MDRSVLDYCKAYLLQSSVVAYGQARRIEARINLKGGIIIPLMGLAVAATLVREWGLVVLSVVLMVVFVDGFRRSFDPELRFILAAYYNCCIIEGGEMMRQRQMQHNKPIAGE